MEYISITRNAQILRSKKLSGSIGVRGYRISPVTADFSKLDLPELGKAIRSLDVDHIILSHEEWFAYPREWARIISALAPPVRVVVYVRPQVPYLNSAWWQWGAWSGQDFKTFVALRTRSVLWTSNLSLWRAIPGIDRMTVRLLPRDVIVDFFETVLGAPVPAGAQRMANRGLPATVLRLMQRNLQLRPGPHDSEIDFVLSRYLDLRGSPPWVIDKETTELVLRETRADNLELLGMLDDESAASMQQDRAWWDAEAFQDKKVEAPSPKPIPPDELERLCAALLDAAQKLDRDAVRNKDVAIPDPGSIPPDDLERLCVALVKAIQELDPNKVPRAGEVPRAGSMVNHLRSWTKGLQ